MLYRSLSSAMSVAALSCVLTPLAVAQVTVGIEDYATIPGVAPGVPARMSVMTADPAGRLFLNDQRGPLFTVDRDTRSVTQYLSLADDAAYPTLDLRTGAEPGFQSFAFHPDFYNDAAAGFGRFYTIHSSDNTAPTPDFNPGGSTVFHSVLLEWNTDTPGAATFQAADAGQPFREVARFKQPFGNHNAGLIAFNTSVGPGDADRNNLYVALGDGGSGNDPQNNAQDTGNPYGAILRIDPLGNNSGNGNYGLVADNAFAADADPATLPEIYSYGLRNPQRFGWDDATGDLYIADIGQNAFEEINLAANGGNFGWRLREGNQPTSGVGGPRPPGAIDPIAGYPHDGFLTDTTTGQRAVTLGEVARNTGIPGLDGKLLLGDFPNGIIFTLDVDSGTFDGGSDGLQELQLVNELNQNVRLIDLIRDATGDPSINRTDLRFSLGIDGEVFILNKQDNVLRRLVAIPEPASLTLLLGAVALTAGRRSRRA